MRYFWIKVTKEHSLDAHRPCGRINTLCSHLKTRFKRNLHQNMLEKCFMFLDKAGKIVVAQPSLSRDRRIKEQNK